MNSQIQQDNTDLKFCLFLIRELAKEISKKEEEQKIA